MDTGKSLEYWKRRIVQDTFPAIRRQEGPALYDPKRQIDTRDQTIRNSTYNNAGRWMEKYPGVLGDRTKGPPFLDFMGNEGGPFWNNPESIRSGATGWAKPGAPNDDGTNQYWIPKIKEIMKQQLGEPTYNYLHDMNIVMQPNAPWEGRQYA